MEKVLYGALLALALVFFRTVHVSATVNPEYGDVIKITPLEISDFSFGSVNNERLEDVRFTVSGGTGSYEYALAVGVLGSDGGIEGSREFYQSSATLGQEVVLNCDLRDLLDSYNQYVLILNVWKTYGQLEISESAIANGTFSYVNSNTPDAIEDFRVIVDVAGHAVYIDYADWAVRSAQSYLVFVDDGSQEAYINTLQSDETGTAVLIEEDANSLTIEVSYKDGNGRQSEILKKTVEIIDFVTFEVAEVTANAQAKISYDTPKEITVKVYVSKGHIFSPAEENEDYQEIKLSGRGFFSVNLYEFDNLISIEYDAGNNITIVKQATVHRSLVNAPILILPEHMGAISVSEDTFDIVGLTESGATITINGLPVSTENDGSFVTKVELMDGENVFEITASDGAGNIAAQNVVIIKTDGSSGSDIGGANMVLGNVFLMGSSFMALLYILFMFIFRKRFNKMWGKSRPQAIINLCRNIATPFFVLAATYFGYAGLRYNASSKVVDSKAFAESGLINPTAMYDGIIKNQMNSDEFLVSAKLFAIIGSIFGFFLGASILYHFIKKALKRPKDSVDVTGNG